MDINHVTAATEITSLPLSAQITIQNANFTDNLADDIGGLMKLDIDRIMMTITNTVFYKHSGTKGGVFYVTDMQ